jgi:hypothetical protein
VLLFHRGSFVRTGTDEPYAGAFLNADASDRDTVVIDYTYRRPWDPDLASASGRARLTFTWDGQAVATEDALPEELTGFTGDLLISTDGFGPAFDWGVTRAVAEEALGTTFDLLDLGGGCQQGTLAGVPHVTFAIEDGLVAAASVTEVSDIGPVPVTPTGLTLGDPVGDVTESYPDAVEGADPSDASTVRWTVTDGDRTAQFFSFDAATVSGMQFGLTNSVGEAPCV